MATEAHTYSRVKQTIAKPHSANPFVVVETMSDYWHSLSKTAPRQHDLLQRQHPRRHQYQHSHHTKHQCKSSLLSYSSSSPDSYKKRSSAVAVAAAASVQAETSSMMDLCVDTTITSHPEGKENNIVSAPSSASPVESTACLTAYGFSDKTSRSTSSSSSSSGDSDAGVNHYSDQVSDRTPASSQFAASSSSSPVSSCPSMACKDTSSKSTSTLPSTSSLTLQHVVASSIQSVHAAHSSAAEQGRALAQRSRTSLNRLLDTVLDNATSLAESSAAHESYSEGEDRDEKGKGQDMEKQKAVKTVANVASPVQQQQHRQIVKRAKFFVCGDSEEDESDEEVEWISSFRTRAAAVATATTLASGPIRSPTDTGVTEQQEHHDGDCEDFDVTDDQDDEEEEASVFDKKKPINVQQHHRTQYAFKNTIPTPSHHPVCKPAGGLERRQSLLSHLFLAEKQLKQKQRLQQLQLDQQQEWSNHCDSTPNSDGEATAMRMVTAPMPQILYQGGSLRKKHGHDEEDDRMATKTSLVRTKKVYTNLAELAKVDTKGAGAERTSYPSSTPTTTIATTTTTTSYQSASSTSTAAASSSTISTQCTCTVSSKNPSLSSSTTGGTGEWTRSQVQVQIQSLMAQSTLTAQRALMTASATLSDVLFRAQ
ncbi:hypothetical protein EDD11_000694 [Mortierella claussenii]|nr:hypothetical protein EDD11_000694 [Mortierella claussenii]